MLHHKGIAARITALLFAVDKHQDDREDDTDDYACGKRKIEGEVLAFVKEVTGKFSEPRYFPSQEEKQTQACNDQANDNQYFAETGKIKHTNFSSRMTLLNWIAAQLPLPAMPARRYRYMICHCERSNLLFASCFEVIISLSMA